MTQSKTRYFKVKEIDTNIFSCIELSEGKLLATNTVPGLETRCDKSKLGFHFWVFLPGGETKLKCLACNKVVITDAPIVTNVTIV